MSQPGQSCPSPFYSPVLCPVCSILLVTAMPFLAVTVSQAAPFRPLLPSGLGLNHFCSGSPQQPSGCLSSSFHPTLTLSSVVFFKASVRLLKFWCFPFQQNPDSLALHSECFGPQSILGFHFPSLSPTQLCPAWGVLRCIVFPSRGMYLLTLFSPSSTSWSSGPTMLSPLLKLCHLSFSSRLASNLGITLSTLFTRLIPTSAAL